MDQEGAAPAPTPPTHPTLPPTPTPSHALLPCR
jgi:hypothetical protein